MMKTKFRLGHYKQLNKNGLFSIRGMRIYLVFVHCTCVFG